MYANRVRWDGQTNLNKNAFRYKVTITHFHWGYLKYKLITLRISYLVYLMQSA